MAQMSDLPEHLIAWTTTWHLREATLTQAINLLINYHHRLPLTQRWGGRHLLLFGRPTASGRGQIPHRDRPAA